MSTEEVPAAPVVPIRKLSRSVTAERRLSRARKQDLDSPGLSQQIPIKVIERAQHETISPPLGERSFEELTQLLVDSTDHAVCVDQIATDVAGTGWHLSPINDDVEIDPAEEQVALEFLEMPNSEDTLTELLKKAMIDYGAIANAWVELVREGNKPDGLPTQLVHAPGIAMRIRSNLAGYVMLSLETNRWAYFRKLFSDPEDPTSLNPRTGEVLNEMIFWRRYHPGSPWYGIPRIVPAIRAIKGSLYASERNIRFFLNRAMPEWAVIVEGQTDNVNTEELNALLDDLEEHWKNCLKGEDYKTWIGYLPVGITIKLEKVSIEVDDATHQNYQKNNRDEIFRANGMMPNRAGVIESGNIGGGTGEAQIEIYKTSTIEPPQSMIERTINMILHAERPKGFGLRTLKFELDDIDSIDEFREAQIAQMLASTGWPSFNDGRAYLTRFAKMDFEEIPENWADLPPNVVIPQLGGFIETPVPGQEGGALPPGMTPSGVPVVNPSIGPGGSGMPFTPLPGVAGARAKSPITTERAMLHLRDKGLGRSRRNGS